MHKKITHWSINDIQNYILEEYYLNFLKIGDEFLDLYGRTYKYLGWDVQILKYKSGGLEPILVEGSFYKFMMFPPSKEYGLKIYVPIDNLSKTLKTWKRL